MLDCCHNSKTSPLLSQGLPLSLSGVRRIMEAMDWGDIADFIHFGQVGADQIDDCKFYVLIAPQNVVGSTIMTNLNEMVRLKHMQGKALKCGLSMTLTQDCRCIMNGLHACL